jgi:hypothetical protein
VVPANYAINHENKAIDIDRSLVFVKIKFQSVDEAKRRAYVVASLSYDIH